LDLLHFGLQQLHHRGALKLALLQGEEQELDEGGVQNDGPAEGLFHAWELREWHSMAMMLEMDTFREFGW